MIPAVSVIIPVYNAEKYLEQCMGSVISQTLSEIEIICINDGSTDKSLEILKAHAGKDTRINVESRINQGLSCARNRGMELASGEYIAFVDSDDFIAPNMMETLYRLAKQHDAEIAVGDIFLYDHRTGGLSAYRDQELYRRLDKKCVSLEEAPELIGCIGAWDRIYLRSFLADIGAQFPPGMIYEDAAFTADTLTHAKRVAVCADKLYYYRKNAGGSITDKEITSDLHKRHFLNIQRMIQNTLKDTGQPDGVYAEYLRYFIGQAFAHQMYASAPGFFREFFFGVKDMLAAESFRLIPKDIPFKTRLYAIFLKYGLVGCCRLYFAVRIGVRRILRGQGR